MEQYSSKTFLDREVPEYTTWKLLASHAFKHYLPCRILHQLAFLWDARPRFSDTFRSPMTHKIAHSTCLLTSWTKSAGILNSVSLLKDALRVLCLSVDMFVCYAQHRTDLLWKICASENKMCASASKRVLYQPQLGNIGKPVADMQLCAGNDGPDTPNTHAG